MLSSDLIAFGLVMLCWCAFAAGFLLRRRPAQAQERKRDPSSRLGIALQAVSYALVWAVPRAFRPLVAAHAWVNAALLALAVLTAAGSVWLTAWALRTLGREWSLTARLVEGHRLVTTGPYALVRHPIYTGMAGLLLATGLTYSRPSALVLALVVFWAGTLVRVRSEEGLLRAAFGAEYDAYARHVPAVLPWLY
ncbi:MAG TPA: isoprenylcysteine carboxylmethyltransferase family protein [Pyrinomonadaceae bacterium]|jgi:protein-S-isoprenylcysteine O-methyltransferase Ste14